MKGVQRTQRMLRQQANQAYRLDNQAVIEPEQMEYSALHISIEGGEHRPLHIDIDVPSPAAACDQAAKLEHGQAADCRRCLARNECLELGRARFVEVPLCQCA